MRAYHSLPKPRRTAVLGISDGGSVALSLAAANPMLFQAAMSVSAGFCADPPRADARASPRMFMLHGAQDRMFPLARVGVPLRDRLLQLGYAVEHRVAEAGHVPTGWQEEFLEDWLALDAK